MTDYWVQAPGEASSDANAPSNEIMHDSSENKKSAPPSARFPRHDAGARNDTPSKQIEPPFEGKQSRNKNNGYTHSTSITSFSVTLDKKIDLKQKKGEKEDFGILDDRDLFVSIATTEERWLFENIDTDIILCEIAQKLRTNPTPIDVTPIELLVIGREIGRSEKKFKL